jgi:hypothetical protein
MAVVHRSGSQYHKRNGSEQLSAKAAVMMRETHYCRSKPKADLAIILSPFML